LYHLGRPESHKDGAVPYKTDERRALQRYAVSDVAGWGSMDMSSRSMIQCRALRWSAGEWKVRPLTGSQVGFSIPNWVGAHCPQRGSEKHGVGHAGCCRAVRGRLGHRSEVHGRLHAMVAHTLDSPLDAH